MTWWYLVIAGILYLLFQKEIQKQLKKIQKWLKLNKDKIEEWKKIPEIWDAYIALKEAIEKAGLDKRWEILEILDVLRLAIILLEAVKQHEEK